MAKKKSKELLLAEFLYAYGRRDALKGADILRGDEKEIIEHRAERALKQWKERELLKKNPSIHPDDVLLPFNE